MIKNLARKFTTFLERQQTHSLDFYREVLQAITAKRATVETLADDNLRQFAAQATSLTDCLAAASIAIERVLGMRPFDVQILGAIAMADGRIAEMQTGEGKTLTAVMPVAFHAAQGDQVHVLTANDYLARRDAEWMGDVYRFLGLTVGFVTQGMSPEERRKAYACDVAYATPNEVGFDYLRDSLALKPEELVQRGFGAALLDEVDSILIDEARIPLVIAGGAAAPRELVHRIAQVVRQLHRYADFHVDEHGRNVLLTDAGAARVEAALGCGNLYEEHNLSLFTALSDALHAAVLLRRDVDYVVRGGGIEIVDEFKGRIADRRRWPAGLQTALEAKEGVELRAQGRILGSITLQSLVKLYHPLCGMTGTAATQAGEFRQVYGLDVVAIPTNRPVIRSDQRDVIFPTRGDRDRAVVETIARNHAFGRPVLVGTSSVADSERLSAQLAANSIPHRVLNARNDAEEAPIIAQAGQAGAVTISTNMAGRGTDIRLGEGVAELGGLLVIGACRHEARRIDLQLRGRAGRQGDPGESRFFLSLEDDLMVRFGLASILNTTEYPAEAMDHLQRIIEGENLEIRKTLLKYDSLIENQRRMAQGIRSAVLHGERECENPRAALLKIDELWSDYLADIAEMKSGIHWVSFGGKNPFDTFVHDAAAIFEEVERGMEAAITNPAEHGVPDTFERGTTWTYVTTDQPLGDYGQRLARGIARTFSDIAEMLRQKR
ncbi:MAG: accessory Sec system translocase SecA2 [Bryobacterales bacterium]|nr:accessory Sec system translocase SecA2 [Bryobacterales bacterium]